MMSASRVALLVACICLPQTRPGGAAAVGVTDAPRGPMIECGETPEVPVNVTYFGGHVAGIYTMGRIFECYSQRTIRDKSYLYIIYNVFGRDCGGNTTKDTRTISVRLQHHYGLVVGGDTVHVLTCNYAKQVKVTHRPVKIMDPALFDDTSSPDSTTPKSHSDTDSGMVLRETTSGISVLSDRTTGRPVLPGIAVGHTDDFNAGLFHDAGGSDGGDGDYGSAYSIVNPDKSSTQTPIEEKRVNHGGEGTWFGDTGAMGNTLPGDGRPMVPGLGPHADDASLSSSRHTSSGGTGTFSDDGGLPLGVGDGEGIWGQPSLHRNNLALPSVDPRLHSDDPTLAGGGSSFQGDPDFHSDDPHLPLPPSGLLPFHQPDFHPLNPLMTPPQADTSSQAPKTKPLLKPGVTPGAMFPSATTAPSVLQLNVIDEDGDLTAVVYSGKPVALELHSAHNSPFGVPLVRQCRVTNPLEKLESNTVEGFSAHLIQDGCGVGDVLPRSAGFRRGRRGFTTLFFAINRTWAQQTALLFSCDIVICAEMGRCKQTCPPRDDRAPLKGSYDITLVLDSQVVTSCPSSDKTEGVRSGGVGAAILPECFPGGHHRQNALLPPPVLHDTEKNLTDAFSADSNSSVGIHESPTSWLVHHLHYVIIICVLGLLIVVFMCGTFFKMASMHHQLRRDNKMAADSERATVASDTHDQTTQTTRPLPRIPSGRSHGHGHSRRRGNGASTAVVQTDDAPRARPMSDPQLSPLENSPELSPPLSVPQLADESRARAADVTSVDGSHGLGQGSPQVSPVFDICRRSPGVRSFQSTTTTMEETSSERHVSIIEVKTPAKTPRDSGHGWTTHEHLATFTGGNPGSGSNTLERERGVVLGVNSLRRYLDREQQLVGGPKYFNTPAPCSEDSTPKELGDSLPRDREAGAVENGYMKAGIRTAPHCGSTRRCGTVVIVNAQEETTRL